MITSLFYHADCMEMLKRLPAESIDLVVTDPPYKIVGGGCSENTSLGGCLSRKLEYEKCGKYNFLKGTKHINLGGVFNDAAKDVRAGKMFHYNNIAFSEWLPEVYRVLKKGTHCYIMVNGRNLAQLQNAAEQTGFVFQNILVWDNGNCTPNKYYMQSCEFILLLSKRPSRKINNMGSKNIISIPNIIGKKGHPTEKPVELLEHIIENSSNVGDFVLDPFAGIATTLSAAANLKRRFIGFEIDERYFFIGMLRLIKNTAIQDCNKYLLKLKGEKDDGEENGDNIIGLCIEQDL